MGWWNTWSRALPHPDLGEGATVAGEAWQEEEWEEGEGENEDKKMKKKQEEDEEEEEE